MDVPQIGFEKTSPLEEYFPRFHNFQLHLPKSSELIPKIVTPQKSNELIPIPLPCLKGSYLFQTIDLLGIHVSFWECTRPNPTPGTIQIQAIYWTSNDDVMAELGHLVDYLGPATIGADRSCIFGYLGH